MENFQHDNPTHVAKVNRIAARVAESAGRYVSKEEGEAGLLRDFYLWITSYADTGLVIPEWVRDPEVIYLINLLNEAFTLLEAIEGDTSELLEYDPYHEPIIH